MPKMMTKLDLHRFFSLSLLFLSCFSVVLSASHSITFLRSQYCVVLFEIIILMISIKEFFIPSQSNKYGDYFLDNICTLVFLFPSILQIIGCIYSNFTQHVFLDFSKPFYVNFNLIIISFLSFLFYLFITIKLAKNFEKILLWNKNSEHYQKILFVLTPILWPILIYISISYIITKNNSRSILLKCLEIFFIVLTFIIGVIGYHYASGIANYIITLFQYVVLAFILENTLNHTIKINNLYIPIQLKISLFLSVFLLLVGNVHLNSGYRIWQMHREKYNQLYPSSKAYISQMSDDLIANNIIIDDYLKLHTIFKSIHNDYDVDKYQKILVSYLVFFHGAIEAIDYGRGDDINLHIKMYPMFLSDARKIYCIDKTTNIDTELKHKSISVFKEMQDFIYKSNIFDLYSIKCILELEKLIQLMHDGKKGKNLDVFTEIDNIYLVDILLRNCMWEFYFIYVNAVIDTDVLNKVNYEYDAVKDESFFKLRRYFPFLAYYCASVCYYEETKRNARIFSFILENNSFEGYANNCIALMWFNDEIYISPFLLRLENQIQTLQKQKFLLPWSKPTPETIMAPK